MRLICLNLWGGRVHKPLIEYLKNQNADIFCFQEVLTNTAGIKKYRGFRASLLGELTKILPDHTHRFDAAAKGFDFHARRTGFDLTFGQAIFVKDDIEIISSGVFTIHKGKKIVKDPLDDFRRILQFVKLRHRGKNFSVFNVHGISTWPKTDTKARLVQSKAIRRALGKFRGPKILCGDFNLAPEAKSLAMLENNMAELVKKYKIGSTRPKMKKINYMFSDYMLISKGIKIVDFNVPKITVSDHLPLILEFDL